MTKRRKKASKKASKRRRVSVCEAKLDRLAHLGATHHKTLMELKRSATVIRKKTSKKGRKKAGKKRARRR